MKKQKQNIEHSLEKVYIGIEKALNGMYTNNELILTYLDKREGILLKTQRKIKKLARISLVNFYENTL